MALSTTKRKPLICRLDLVESNKQRTTVYSVKDEEQTESLIETAVYDNNIWYCPRYTGKVQPDSFHNSLKEACNAIGNKFKREVQIEK